MPNHITNRITVNDKSLELSRFLNEEGFFDFNTIIKAPKCLEDFNPHLGIIGKAENLLGLEIDESHPTLKALKEQNRHSDIFNKLLERDLPDVVRACKNYFECGYFYWNDFNKDKWGTKWNAYESTEIENDSIDFNTAWNAPHKIIEKIAEMTKGSFTHEWADEDTGHNVGFSVYTNGELIQQEELTKTKEGYELAFKLTGGEEYYELLNGQYQYKDGDD